MTPTWSRIVDNCQEASASSQTAQQDPLSPPELAHTDTTQRLATSGRTETTKRRADGSIEEHIAARTVTAKITFTLEWVMALAASRAILSARWLRTRRGRNRCPFGLLFPRPVSFPLSGPGLLARLALSILPGSFPTTPHICFVTTLRRAIPLRPEFGTERAVAAFQEADPRLGSPATFPFPLTRRNCGRS